MAKMIPVQMDSDGISKAEQRIFGLLKTDPATKNWTVLHSLGLARRLDGTIRRNRLRRDRSN